MPVMNGIAATQQIRRQLPTSGMTTFDDEEDIVKALIAGASGYLLKDIPTRDLAHAIQLARRGIYQLEPFIAGKLVGVLNKQAGLTPVTPSPSSKEASARAVAAQFDLTEREMEVLRLIATGANNREIAEKLVVSEGTVKNHVSNILSRLGLGDRTQTAIYARERHLLS